MLLKTSLPLLVIAIFALPISTQAQALKFSDVYISAGANWTTNDGTLEDFMKLAPNSKLINSDFSEFNGSHSYFYTGNHSAARASFLVGLDILKDGTPGKFAPQLRVGLTYSPGIFLTYSFNKDESFPYDTLTSSQTGNHILVDSVNYQGYSFGYSSDNLLLDISIVFKTNPLARWSLYGGIGIAGGMSLNATTTAHYYENYHLTSNNDNYTPLNNEFRDYSSHNQDEIFRNENSFLVSGYIPLGVDFRIGKNKEFWKRTHLFAELRPAVNMNFIPELGTYTQASFSHNIGIRIS